MDVSAVVLNKLLLERSIDIWSKLKLAFLDSAYATVYSAISRHYDKHSSVPSFEELELELREGATARTLATLRLVDEPDISAEVALEALLDQYTQNQAINLLDKFVDKLPVYDSAEIKENLSNIVLALDEKTLTTEGVFNMADMLLFKNADEIARERVFLGINNNFDAILGGVARQEYILIGGERGSGKSIAASNIVVNQYEMGNSAVIFTIEMIASEVNERQFAMLADVPYLALKNGTLAPDEYLKVVKVRANMFQDADDLVVEYLQHRDRFKFEQALVRQKQLKQDNQIVIIDDRALTLTSIDLHLGKLKARFGDKLKVCVVDYLNQIVFGEGNKYDWQPQIEVSSRLKNLGRKHDVVMVSPYQIDASGEARFAKGILDAADIALVMKPHDKSEGAISMNTTKIRGGPPAIFTSPMNWDTLRISPQSIEKPVEKEKIKKAGGKKAKDDSNADIPWDA